MAALIHAVTQNEPIYAEQLDKLGIGSPAVRTLAEKLLADGPGKLTAVERLLVMSDAHMMDWLHQQTWLCPSELLAPWWRAAIQKYSHPDWSTAL